jgi:hypothetical protein
MMRHLASVVPAFDVTEEERHEIDKSAIAFGWAARSSRSLRGFPLGERLAALAQLIGSAGLSTRPARSPPLDVHIAAGEHMLGRATVDFGIVRIAFRKPPSNRAMHSLLLPLLEALATRCARSQLFDLPVVFRRPASW